MKTKACRTTGKASFPSELEAKIALASRVWRDKGEIRYYHCAFCGKYHLTSQEARS